ncbi:MAG: tryptophan synthase subunit alpha, partial [Planctomycetia bacterium]
IVVGFGISSPEQARAVARVADGVFVGSAVVRHLAEAASQPRVAIVRGGGGEVGDLAAAVGPARG